MSAVRVPRELYPDRSMPVEHRDLDESTAYRFLQQQCGQQAGTIGRLQMEYDDLVDLLLTERASTAAMRTELAGWRAWGGEWRTSEGDAP
jgi:hypothetical protein